MTRCKRCLLTETDETGIANKIRQIIAGIPSEHKTELSEYEKRLSFCRSCESLENGVCMMCGCFIELRAIKVHQSCPLANGKW